MNYIMEQSISFNALMYKHLYIILTTSVDLPYANRIQSIRFHKCKQIPRERTFKSSGSFFFF